MKHVDLREKTSFLIIGRWFIILSIVITSSLSFTLGYFVGKSVNTGVKHQQSFITSQEKPDLNNSFTEKEKKITQNLPQNQEIQTTEEIQRPQQSPEILQSDDIKTENIKKAPQKQKSSNSVKTQGTHTSKEKITYIVQAGAFRNEPDAENLKEKLIKKGYKAYVFPSESKKHETLYKVGIGQFKTRKEAEVISLKIKKSEGFQTFVTFRYIIK